MIAAIRSVFRLVFFLISSMCLVLFYCIGSLFSANRDDLALRLRARWLSIMPKLLGIQAKVMGRPLSRPAIYVCNHRSYIDPVTITPYCRALVIVKADVQSWPLIGAAVRAVGVVFVKRESKQSRSNTRTAIKQLIQQGQSVLLFPEGTTSKSPQSLPFRPGTFMIAAENNIPIIPIALEYEREEVAWIGADLFFPHFMKTFGFRKTRAAVKFGTAQQSKNWEELLNATQSWIDEELLTMRTAFEERKS